MIWVVLAKIVTLGFGAYASIRARYAMGWWLVVPALATIALPAALLFFGSAALATAPWAPFVVALVVGVPLTRATFRALDREPAISPRVDALETAAYAFLGNTLLDVALAFIIGSAVLMAGDG